jgi:ABC-type transporter Mla subunit MlaD
VKRLAILGTLCALGVAFVVTGPAAPSGQAGDSVKVNALFHNAAGLVAGEDVKIAGVAAGTVSSVDLTDGRLALVEMQVDSPFAPFRADARCQVRSQSLIGERFIQCDPGTIDAGALPAGPGGIPAVPVDQDTAPIDLDLLFDVFRAPYRERLAIILNELGTGVAGRGDDLRQAIRNADPALKETDKVLKILADQNRVLADLARNGDAILAPLSRDRAQVADFVSQANTVAQATAERSSDLELNIAKLPAFLRELKPTMQALGGLSDQMTPVLTDLGAEAGSINRFIKELGPFSQAGIPAFQSLGAAADVGGPALTKSKPIITNIGQLASTSKPLTTNLASLLTSLKDTGGIERLMDYLFYQVAAINGFDADGHYLRAGLILNACSQYAIAPSPDCLATFPSSGNASARAAGATSLPGYADTRRSNSLRQLDAYFHGKKLDLGGGVAQSSAKDGAQADTESAPAQQPALAQQQAAPAAAPAQQPAPAAAPSQAPASGTDPSSALLDYLLGGGG